MRKRGALISEGEWAANRFAGGRALSDGRVSSMRAGSIFSLECCDGCRAPQVRGVRSF